MQAIATFKSEKMNLRLDGNWRTRPPWWTLSINYYLKAIQSDFLSSENYTKTTKGKNLLKADILYFVSIMVIKSGH